MPGWAQNRLIKGAFFGVATALVFFLFIAFALESILLSIVGDESFSGREHVIAFITLAFAGYISCICLGIGLRILGGAMFIQVAALFIAVGTFMLVVPTLGVLQQSVFTFKVTYALILALCATLMWYALFRPKAKKPNK